MSRSSVLLIIGIPWATAVAVLLMVTKIHAFSGRVHWGLLGSACICFSIGCLARTSVGLHDMAQRAKQESAAALDRTSA
ncbi:MAG: hypothetical protein KXJ50_03395 [Vulcanococcus sp.]|jgi:hypothetical protein|uniref:hypothetical protein n=1 Tax=Vulcanococcus sp. TaxID=2856995 RepID=UPI0025E6EB95|nr:hypothetical protein [Vulcanococcus sp.]MBW0165897.1 hypothetical protein [Vulcanococcus sp.]MBW0173412.1 hypothetical protein [Vulcanococcus sp.]MBW0180098.1 hypothetical protein [Vulcanococcus sp.]